VAVKAVIKKRAKKAPAKRAAVKKAPAKKAAVKKAPAKKAAVKKAPVKKKAVKKAAAAKSTPKKKATDLNAIGNFEVEMERSYYIFHDLYDGYHFNEEWLTDPFRKKLLKEEDGFASYWSDGDPTNMLDDIENSFMVLHYEQVTIRPFGKCPKCKFVFKDRASAFRDMFCTECGTKRIVESEFTYFSQPKDMNRVLNKPSNFEKISYSTQVKEFIAKSGMGRFMCQNGWFVRSYDVFNTTILEIQESFGDDDNWHREDAEYESYSEGAALMGVCSKCKTDFRPLEKFCSQCGTKQPWFEYFK
jgi:hypothetical protein